MLGPEIPWDILIIEILPLILLRTSTTNPQIHQPRTPKRQHTLGYPTPTKTPRHPKVKAEAPPAPKVEVAPRPLKRRRSPSPDPFIVISDDDKEDEEPVIKHPPLHIPRSATSTPRLPASNTQIRPKRLPVPRNTSPSPTPRPTKRRRGPFPPQPNVIVISDDEVIEISDDDDDDKPQGKLLTFLVYTKVRIILIILMVSL